MMLQIIWKYKEINNYIIDIYETRNRNFEDLQNLNEIHSNVLNLLKELNNIININNESIK